MEKTKLWEIVSKMPKGAILHAHHAACVPMEWVIEQAISNPGLYFISEKALVSESDRKTTGIRCLYAPQSGPRWTRGCKTNWNPDYKPESLVPIQVAADSFPGNGRVGFMSWLKSRCVVTPDESLDHYLGVNDAWRKFQYGIRIVNSMIHNEDIFRPYCRKMFDLFSQDGVQWLEVRKTFKMNYRSSGKDDIALPEEMARVFWDEIVRFKESDIGKKRGFLGVRLIWTGLRFWSAKQILEGNHALFFCFVYMGAYDRNRYGRLYDGEKALSRPNSWL